MGVDIDTYRAKIGTFRHSCGLDVVTFVMFVNFSHGLKSIGSVLFIGILLIMAGIELNPGPKEQEISKQSDFLRPASIRVTGIPKGISEEEIQMIFEHKSNVGVKTIIIDDKSKSAIIEFLDYKAVESLMQQLPICICDTLVSVDICENPVDIVGTDVQANQDTCLENKQPTKIKVTGLPEGATEEFLFMFFENKREGCGKVKTVKVHADQKYAVIEFEDAEAIDILMKKQPIQILQTDVQIEAISEETPKHPSECNTIQVPGLQKTATEDVLVMLSDNVNRQGGGEVKAVYKPVDIVVTDVQENQDTCLDNKQPTKIKVTGLPEGATEEFLLMFFENERQGCGKVKTVTVHADQKYAVIEFEDAAAIDIIVKKQPIQILQVDVQIEVIYPKSPSTSKLLVYALPRNVSIEFLTMFFENEHRKGGGPVKKVDINEDKHAALVEFEEAESVITVLQKRPICINGKEVTVEEYAQDTWDEPLISSAKVKVSGLDAHITEDFLLMFFENERRQGGGKVKTVEIDKNTKSAIIEFEVKSAVIAVLKKRPICIGGKEVIVEEYAQDTWDEPSIASAKIKVSGLDAYITEDFLLMFFENERRQGGGKVKTCEIDKNKKSAIIEFEDTSAVITVLQKRPICINGKEVTVEEYDSSTEYKSTELKVSNLPKTTTEEFLTLFFENEDRFGGGKVKHVELNTNTCSAVINFEAHEAVSRVLLKKPIIISGKEIIAELFDSSIEPKSTQLKVSNLPNNTTEEFLTLFFENEDRYGGGKVIHVELNESTCSAVIDFEAHQAVSRVLLKKPIIISGQEIIAEVFDESQEPKTLLVKGIPTQTTEEYLIMFFENESRQGGGHVETVEINPYRKCAIIEFEKSESVKKIIQKQPIFLLNSEVDVCAFTNTNIIEVRGFDCRGTPERDVLECFENLSVSGDGKVIKVFIDRLANVAFLTLESNKAAKHITSRKEVTFKRLSLEVNTCILTEDDLEESASKQPQDQQQYPQADESVTGHIDNEQVGRKSVEDVVKEFSKRSRESSDDYSSQQRHYSAHEGKGKPPTKPSSDPPTSLHPVKRRTTITEVKTQHSSNQTEMQRSDRTQRKENKYVIKENIEKEKKTTKHSPVLEMSTFTGDVRLNQRATTDEKETQHSLSYSVSHEQTQMNENKDMTEENFETEIKETDGDVFCKVLQKLGLVAMYPGKISIRDVIAVNPHESSDQEKQRVSLDDIPWLLLKRLICAHSESRDITVSDEDSIENSMDYDNFSFISEVQGESQSISPLDVFTVVFQCCDPLLKQIFFQKLYLCKIAVPFLIKQWETKTFHKSILSVWPLRSLAIENKTSVNSSEVKSKEVDVLELPTKVLAFARFGRPRYSKSKLINSLLSDQGCKTFFNIDCPSGMTPRVLSNGQIEMFWLPTIGEKKDRFQDAMTFLNMRGDLKENFNMDILSFLAKFVDCIAIVIDLESVLTQTNKVKDILQIFTSVILIIADPLKPEVVKKIERFQSDVNTSKQDMNLRVLSTHKGVQEQNVVDMVLSISKHIISQLKSDTTTALQDRLRRFDKLQTDEDDIKCQSGKKEAMTLMKQMKGDGLPNRWKHTLTPVHSSFSKKLGTLMKKRERERDFDEGENIDSRIKSIRKDQTQSITRTVKLFTDILIRFEKSNVELKFFLCWLHFYIEREKRQILPQLMFENRCAWEKLKKIKGKTTQNPSAITEQENVITNLEEKIDEASFSVQHFFREIGHIFEAILELKVSSSKLGLPPIDKIATIMGRLVADGHQLELIDGESFYMPYMWTKLVLRQVDKCINSTKVMTLSVLGLQSSGKSTLLNTMFGSQFSTRTGRCTRGVHVQLIPARTASFKGTTSPFGYVLVADTEGLRSPELSHVQHEHDNELATVITGIGDITMLNIMGENTSEIRDILQVIVHAFMRLKLTNRNLDIRKSCAFIHQNVTDTSASENMISGLSKLMKTLDEMTKESARSEGILEITTFNQVIEFDINSQVWYLKNLWQGNPPMARVNNEYSESVVDLKCKIIQKALQMKDKSYKSLNDIIEQAHSLWKGVLNEDFVFSFRNSLEIRAYMEMERNVQDKLWHLESFISKKLIDISQNKFAVCDHKHDLRNVADSLIDQLNEMLADEKSKTEEDIKIYFEKNKYKDITIQWKTSQQTRVDILCQKLEQNIRYQINKSLEQRSVEILTVTSHEKHEEELRKKSMEVANKYRGKQFNKIQICHLFGDIWKSFIMKLDTTPYSAESNRKEVRTIFVNCLKVTFKKDHAVLKEAFLSSSFLEPLSNLKKLRGSFKSTGINENDISLSTWQKGKELLRLTNTLNQVTERVNQIFTTTDEIIQGLCQVNDEITELHVKQLIHELEISIRGILNGNSNYDFTTPFYVKICVHVSRYAHPIFEMHNENYFKTQGTAARLEQYRQQQLISFEAHLSNRQSEDIVAKLFSHVIEVFAEEWTLQNLPNEVTSELHSQLPSVKNMVIVEICSDLINKNSFEKFIQYLQAPKEYASLWITEKANYHLFSEKSRAYSRIANSLLGNVFKNVENCLQNLKVSYSDKPSPLIETWLDAFQKTLKATNLSIQTELFRNVKKEMKRIENVAYLTNEILANMVASHDTLTDKFSHHSNGSVKWTGTNPIGRIIQKIWGCPERCAFCGEPCAKNQDHEGSVHYTMQHRPSCCDGAMCSKTELASLTSCEFDIQSDQTHKCNVFGFICNKEKRKDCGSTHRYKEYKTYLPKWDIPPSSNMHDTSKFWMWFVATYKTELKEYYKYKVDNIPVSWNDIKKEHAKESLMKVYTA